MNKNSPLLKMNHVCISYRQLPVVDDVSLQVHPGEVLGIVGESGCGKSTLLKSAIGLLGKEGKVTDGNIVYQGVDILHASQEELRRLRGPEIGMIFQNTAASLCPVRRIENQIYESVLQHERTTKAQIRKKTLELFEKIGLSDGQRILRSYPFELSGGMGQRVGIALAMLQQPKLLLADEPTSALDVSVQTQVVKQLLRIRETFGTAIVLVTHNMGIVESMADQVAVMHQGHLVECGLKEDIMNHPQEVYTRKLLNAVLRVRK